MKLAELFPKQVNVISGPKYGMNVFNLSLNVFCSLNAKHHAANHNLGRYPL